MPQEQIPQLTLRDCFQDFPDPRREHLRLHSLWDIIGLTLCATICGYDNVVEIQEYGEKKFDFLTTFLDLENGVPSHDGDRPGVRTPGSGEVSCQLRELDGEFGSGRGGSCDRDRW
ncbi:MAG: transposase family protein [Planctomycetes bacterium]|nr:transposase family protein [Planctomycetota bacterium]